MASPDALLSRRGFSPSFAQAARSMVDGFLAEMDRRAMPSPALPAMCVGCGGCHGG